MTGEFAILPWEYPGADFDPTPYAQALVEFEGRKGQFLFKMCDGVIYFKDPKRGPTFAIPRQLDDNMRGDQLVEAWSQEVERRNFGLFFWRPLSVLDYSTTTVVASIVRPDFSGWITDALHRSWLEVPRHRKGKIFDVWEGNRSTTIRRTIEWSKSFLVDRDMTASERQPLPSHWALGSEAELERVLSLVMQLYVRRSDSDAPFVLAYQTSNFASPSGFTSSISHVYHSYFRFSSALPSLLRLLEQQFIWVAMEWQYRHANFARTNPLKSMKDKWGDNWRGNYSIETPTLALTIPLVASLSQHQKLELLLDLRDWLEGKVSARQSANLLANTLD